MARPPIKLTPEQCSAIELRVMKGESNRSIAKDFGISETTIRNRFNDVKKDIVEEVATKLADVRTEVSGLPPSIRGIVNARADAILEIRAAVLEGSKAMAKSQELAAKTAYIMSNIANIQASKMDHEEPDIEMAKMVHGFIETSNKAAYQPLELMKANKDLMARVDDDAQNQRNSFDHVPLAELERIKSLLYAPRIT